VVALPSPHHRWSVLNSSVAEVDHLSGFAQALSLGVTSVIVKDTRVAGHMQVSSLNVVLPDTLCLYIMPLPVSGDPVDGLKAIPSLARWFVVSGRQYIIQMKVFLGGPDAQEIYITEVNPTFVWDLKIKSVMVYVVHTCNLLEFFSWLFSLWSIWLAVVRDWWSPLTSLARFPSALPQKKMNHIVAVYHGWFLDLFWI